MPLNPQKSLHLRLWVIIGLAVLPLFLMSFWDYQERRQNAITSLGNDVARMLASARLEEDAAIQNVRLVLEIMSRSDRMASIDPSICSTLAARLMKSADNFINIGAALPDGTVFCSAQPMHGLTSSVTDRAWFQDALVSHGLSAGEYVIGRISRKPGMLFGYPMHDESGQVRVVLFASLPVTWFQKLLESIYLPDGWQAMLLNEGGEVLSQWPAPERIQLPQPTATEPFFTALAQGKKISELVGLDGQKRMYGVSALGLSKTPIVLAIGAPADRSLGHIDQDFQLRVALLVAMALVSALVARFYIYGLIEAWTGKVTRTLQAIAVGKLETRISEFSQVQEFQAVEHGINHMVTELGRRDTELRRLSIAVEQSPESIVITDVNSCIEYVNEAFLRTTGYQRGDVIGKNPRLLNAGKTPKATYEEMWATLRQGQPWRGEFHNTRKDGSTYLELATIAPIFDRQGTVTHYVAVKEDITQRKQSEALVHRLAYYDPLTELPNRTLLQDRLSQASLHSTRSHCHGMLLVIDIDRFKQLNDTRGHHAGDLMLQEVARRIKSNVREQDTVARLSDNTFALVVDQMSEAADTAAAEARLIAQKVHQTLAAPYDVGDTHRPYATTSSIGIALFNGREAANESFLKQAEVALYKAKEEGGNTILFFNTSMQANVEARAALEMGLREAIVQNAFQLFYQVQVDQTGKPVGAEALIRWFDPHGKMISPADFIPLAEETGLIVPIGQWVLETACQQLHIWQQRPETKHLAVAVNVSSKQFHQADFVDQVHLTLERIGIDPSRLKLELTESVILGDMEATIARMGQLRALGLRFSLDDFGTGYSSLSYLKRLPFDQLKIDQSFVRDMLDDQSSAAIVRAILVMSEALGLEVVAEGVETLAQSQFLIDNGCQFCQGYLYGRPTPIHHWEATHLPGQSTPV
ncbi:MAG: EAL domain-containing protein [Burkholderiaceae bacterium]|nr:EAL domain-containing protein [Burkholderiaceae bacterium]